MNEINISNNHSEHPVNKKNLKIYCKDVLNYNEYDSDDENMNIGSMSKKPQINVKKTF